jgi:DNA invertase Pin-like site-specific DNA recombinase
MADADKRRFDVVVCWKFDRFARSVSHLLRALETFNSLGIAFVSLSEQINSTTPTGRMIFTVLGAVAELERSLIAERVRAGLRNARAKGKRLGRPRVAVDAARIRELRSQGLSWPKIAAKLGASVGTVYQAAARGTRRAIAAPRVAQSGPDAGPTRASPSAMNARWMWHRTIRDGVPRRVPRACAGGDVICIQA